MGLYKGLGAVIGGIVPKMAIRFASFECESLWAVILKCGTRVEADIFVFGFVQSTRV